MATLSSLKRLDLEPVDRLYYDDNISSIYFSSRTMLKTYLPFMSEREGLK